MFKPVAVVPCYNHPQTIGHMVESLRARGLHVVVVDDGCEPGCARVLDELATQQGAGMSLVRLPLNQGKGGAMMTCWLAVSVQVPVLTVSRTVYVPQVE